ncbi:Crp/Fnr family transcriptional regulator [Vogesella sp. DC21W]|uniref:Crp/Fnr family transcriptional regulator n=1 Tax=Vogesella aquatica TaxID=2984206 RepID=A0ABT5IUV6_9NEIS|nr:Crp/Fnr family transcriptional regulator [Vogesella aquatica]MDC7715968.1 Crp/Fnr family transcriptional regulator [Vogesella aquatica]
MSQIDIDAFLQHQPLFQQLSPAQRAALVPGTHEVRGQKGQVIFQKGDPCDGMYVVVFGKVKLALTAQNGSEKVMEILHPGQSFAEAVMFLNRPCPVMAQFLEDGLLLHVSAEVIFGAIASDPGFAQRMLAGLSLRLHSMVRDVERYSVENSLQRVISYLLQEGQPACNGRVVHLPVNKNLIASRLNLTPETFSRVLHQLVESVLVEVRGRDIVLMDVEGMQQLVS